MSPIALPIRATFFVPLLYDCTRILHHDCVEHLLIRFKFIAVDSLLAFENEFVNLRAALAGSQILTGKRIIILILVYTPVPFGASARTSSI